MLREVETETLVLALKGAAANLRDKLLGCVSQRAAANIIDEMEAMGPVRLSQVQEAQKQVITIARRLSDEGRITLAGRGGEGVVGRLRSGFGLSDLDVTTTEAGATEVRAGTYLTENIYSDVTVDNEGETEIELNLDLTPSTTLRGKMGSTGDTSLGIFYERDY